MKMLTEEEYARRAADAGRVAVFKEFLADRETPVAALSRLGEDEEAFLLESVAGGEARGRYSFLGLEPSGRVEGADALAGLKTRFASARYVPAPELPSFQGGAVGYVAYSSREWGCVARTGLRRWRSSSATGFLCSTTCATPSP